MDISTMLNMIAPVVIFTFLTIILILISVILFIEVKKSYNEYKLEHPKKSNNGIKKSK